MSLQADAAADNISFLRQGRALVERLTSELFASTSALCPGGSVGAHFRHCLDFYVSFLDGIDGRKIDYNDRERDPELETVSGRALDTFTRVIERLEGIAELDRNEPLLVRGDESARGQDGWSRSTVGRELQFLHSHTIHHFALIGFMLRAAGFEVDGSFGVAPSTLQHWENSAARAS